MDYILYGHILYAVVITIVTLVILIVLVEFSCWTGSIISRIRDKTSSDQKSQNTEDIEMGTANITHM